MWDIFERRLEDPTAAAIRLVEQLINLPLQAAVERIPPATEAMDDFALQQFWRVLKLLRYRDNVQAGMTPDVPALARTDDESVQAYPEQRVAQRDTLEALLAKVDEILTRRTKTTPSAIVPSFDKLQAYSALLEQYNKAMAAYSPAHAAESIAALEHRRIEAERLMAREPLDYLRSDLAEFISSVLATTANCFNVLGNAVQARAHYERAIREAEAHRLHALADGYRLKLAELLFARAGDFDRALRDLLPLRQEMSDREPSHARARITLMLAEAYVNIGDYFEVGQTLQAVEEDLDKLGYTSPDPENLHRTLEGWIETADCTTTNPNAFREALYGVLTAYMSIANMRSKTASSPVQRDAAITRIESLTHINNDLTAHDQEIVECDQRTLESLAPQSSSKSPPPGAQWPAFQQQWEDLAKRVDALRARINANKAPEPLLAEAETSVEEARSLNGGRLVGTLRDMQGDLLLQLERQGEAVRVWRQAYTGSLGAGQLDDALYMLTKIAGAYAGQQDHAAVSDVCGEAIDLIERYRYNVSPAYQQSAFLQQKVHFYSLGVFSAYKLGDYDLMLRRMELTKARASLRQMLQRAPDPDPATLEMEIRQVNAELDRADNETAPVLRERRRTLWDLLAIRRAEANRQQLPSEFSLRAVQEALEPDEAVVYYYWLQPGVLLVVTLDREQIEVTRQLLDNEYTGLVELIDHLGKMTRPVPYMKMIDAYARHLLPEPVQSMLRGKKHVIFSPHRILHLFPFHALRWEGDYLITRLVVSYAPNLTSLLVRYPPSDTATVLAVGAEHFAVPGHSLQPLPGAVREIDDLHVLYTERGVQIKVLREAAASYRRLREWADDGQLSSFRVLHFATHGEDVLGDEPMETYLCLHDGLLDGLEIAGWHLNAELVVLSACHSGKRPFKGRGMNELPGDEMFGLQAAFFSAGALRVVGALWPADDTAAPVVMAAFHRQLAAGLQPEFALQAAVTAYVQNVRKDSLKNPYYWAPFFISYIGRVQISNAAHEH